MKRTFTRLIFLLVTILVAGAADAQKSITLDGICYQCNSDGTAEIKGVEQLVSGNLVLPQFVRLDGVDYQVTRIGDDAFTYNSEMNSITFPDGLVAIGRNAFKSCDGLSSLSFPASLRNIEEQSFFKCTGLTSVVFREGLQMIAKAAFRDCFNLSSVTVKGKQAGNDSQAQHESDYSRLPESVSSIGEYAFARCEGLTSIVLPAGLTSIGDWAFAGCNLTTVINMSDKPQVLKIPIFSEEVFSNATLHVLPNCKAKYEEAAVWSDFRKILEDAYIVTGIDSPSIDNVPRGDVLKMMENGRLIIKKDNRKYNAAGVQVQR